MKNFFIFLIIIFSLLASLPFFKSGYFPTHDGEWAVVRLSAMHRSILDKEFPVRWSGNQNYTFGYPLFEFTYPFPYYFGEIFKLAKLSLVSSIKIVFILSVLVSGIGMFYFAREIFGDLGGLLSSVFYIFAPYRLVNLYVRGSIGESLSLALFPLLFLLLLKLYKENNQNLAVLFSIFFAILLTTHNVIALIFTPFLAALALVLLIQRKDKKTFFFHLLFGFGFGFLLSSFFLIPALLEKQYIALSQTRISDLSRYFVNIGQLINSPWNYGAFGTADSFSPQIGIVHLIAAFLSFIGIFLLKNAKNKKIIITVYSFSLISVIILIFFMLSQSSFFWKSVPLFSNVDFPWRLLTPLIFFISILVGSLGLKKLWPLTIILIIAVVYFNFSHVRPKSYINYPDSYYFTNEATTTSNDELMPIWVKVKPEKSPKEKVEVLSGKADINLLKSSSTRTDFNITSHTPVKIAINTIYFPGWKIDSNGKPADFTYNNPKGIMQLSLPSGNYLISSRFRETPLRIFSDLLSVLGLIGILVFWKFRIIK